MSSTDALKYLVAFAILLFVLRPITGIIIDAFKVMLRLGIAGLILLIIPIGFINNWSHQATGWTHITAQYVPVFALIALIFLSTANLIFLSGTNGEGIVKLVIYIIGGVFTAGNADWIAWTRSVAGIVSNLVTTVTDTLALFAHVL